jgi:hypothetical protein
MKKALKIEITEIFMAKAGKGKKGFNRCFHGTIRRSEGIVYGNIKVNDGYIIANGKDQWELGEKLDEMVLMILDFGLHSDIGKTSIIAETPFFLN